MVVNTDHRFPRVAGCLNIPDRGFCCGTVYLYIILRILYLKSLSRAIILQCIL